MALRIDEIGFGNLKLYQNPDHFCYGVDAVLLADMAAKAKNNFKTAIDLGTGNGIIPHILAYKNKDGKITGIDIISTNIEMAQMSRQLNSLDERLDFIHLDVNEISSVMDRECAELVTCNPPYFPKGGGIVNDSQEKFVARQETTATFDDFAKAAAFLLKDRGHFCIVHRPSRLVDILCSCRKYRLEPKEMRFVYPKPGQVANIVLVHCIKNGGRELKLLPDLVVHNEDGCYTDEIMNIYER